MARYRLWYWTTHDEREAGSYLRIKRSDLISGGYPKERLLELLREHLWERRLKEVR